MPLTNWRAFRKTRRRQTDLDRAKHASPGRSSPLSDLPLAGLTGRWQFCHECAAMVTKWSQPKDEDDNGQRLSARVRARAGGNPSLPFLTSRLAALSLCGVSLAILSQPQQRD